MKAGAHFPGLPFPSPAMSAAAPARPGRREKSKHMAQGQFPAAVTEVALFEF